LQELVAEGKVRYGGLSNHEVTAAASRSAPSASSCGIPP